ncbi:MAG: hypothetical protein M3Q23_05985, partial [Actinomycetota bacterium]|nr:hypothetical protein [Actinomycetota bacterium]
PAVGARPAPLASLGAGERLLGLGDGWPDPGDRPVSPARLDLAPAAPATPVVASNPDLAATFDGIDHFEQRSANAGNQASLEPPDQGLCIGRGFVMETVNQSLRIFTTAGRAVGEVTDLNSFYGYPPAVDYHNWRRGPFVTDPSCLFDPDTRRWFHLALTVDTSLNGTFLGTNHLDLAVSRTSSPVGAWDLFSIPAQDDGSGGTPYHGCDGGPCLGDYPHMGVDANGLYISTNEYALFGDQFTSAQIYAISKRALAAGDFHAPLVHLDHLSAMGTPGFTVWPAQVPGRRFATDEGGTEYFLSSMAAPEAGNATGASDRVALWALTNTGSLDSPAPAVRLSVAVVPAEPYAMPPPSAQRSGDLPLGDCLNSACLGRDPFTEVEATLDSGDTRMQQAVFAAGSVWGALDTAVQVDGEVRAGIAWFLVTPAWSGGVLSASVRAQGYLAVAGQNVTYPAVAALSSGRGAVAFTLLGPDHYPSAAYALLDPETGVGPVHVAAEGVGPSDGFTGYRFFVGGQSGVPAVARWGDYGAAVARPGSIWIASEYVGQTCTYPIFLLDDTCGGTRTQFANWGTRISRIQP